MIKVGFIINPVAGVGGAVALKGSDAVVAEALSKGAALSAGSRASVFLSLLTESTRQSVSFYTAAGNMGEDCLRAAGCVVAERYPVGNPSQSSDTVKIAKLLAPLVDILIFVGGDGTARDVHEAVGSTVLCLGVPAGVKMHSGVFAVNPQSASEVLNKMASHQILAKTERLVKDIDEEAFRLGKVIAKTYGSLWVPEAFAYLQHTKEGGKENETLAQLEIAQDIIERMLPDFQYFIGPGSTTFAIKNELGIEGTLLGVDVVRNGQLLVKDATAAQLLKAYRPGQTVAVLTVIGGQGHLLGRGNQQFSAELVKKLGLEHLWVVATQTKIRDLEGRPLWLDTGDAKLDLALSGMVEITVGYHQKVVMALKG
ncbi:MAG TPA: ATP-NAD kinase family protein [Pseudomonadales bacterium]|nr:ATP-NAD kinase family protein [Pseudomonadales bacterium]